MPSLLDNLGSLVASFFHAITAVLGSILAVFQTLLNTILGVIQTAFAAVGTTVSGLAQTFEGLLKFVLSKSTLLAIDSPLLSQANSYLAGNIVVIGTVVGGLFLYGVYQQRNGKPVTAAPAGTKKTN